MASAYFEDTKVRIPNGYREVEDGIYINNHGVEYALVAYGNGKNQAICLETIYSKHVRTIELEQID